MPHPEQAQSAGGDLIPEVRLAQFLAKYEPAIAALAEAILVRMRARLPHSLELVYDNYNALAIGFGPTDRASDAIFSIAVFPRWVSLFFLQAKGLSDPGRILRGAGKRARHIVLTGAEALDDPLVTAMMDQALQRASVALVPDVPHRLVIKSVSAKQRPRRPAAVKPPTRRRGESRPSKPKAGRKSPAAPNADRKIRAAKKG